MLTKRYSFGYIYVLLVPYAAAISSIDGLPDIAGFRYTGWIWILMLFSGCLLIFLVLGIRKNKIHFPIFIWVPWFTYVWLSLLWIDGFGLKNLQDALQLTMPLVIGIAASISIRHPWQLRAIRRALKYSLLILFLIFIFLENPLSISETLTPSIRAMALTACLIGCVFVSTLSADGRRAVLYWLISLAFTVFSKSRMATLALLMIWSIYPLRFRLSRKVITTILIMIFGIGLYYTPIFQKRFFGEERGTATDLISGNFLSAGRFEAWPLIWQEAKKHPIIGAGVGESSEYVSTVWPRMDKPHNDYLRIIFEFGFIGLTFFIATVAVQIYVIRKKIVRSDGEVKYAFIASFLGFFVLLLTAVTDNPITYNLWFTDPLFAVLGSAYGVEGARKYNSAF